MANNNYLFECVHCSNREYKDIPMSKYDEEKNKQKCSKCGSAMTRIIEFGGSVKLCEGMYGANGWNN